MRFWDSSALVPLVYREATSDALFELLEQDPAVVAWWAAELECVSALSRIERSNPSTADEVEDALARLDELRRRWHEVAPSAPVRTTARRLLRVHALRAADAMQLGAALVASEGEPASLGFVSLDDRLVAAARREGLAIVVL